MNIITQQQNTTATVELSKQVHNYNNSLITKPNLFIFTLDVVSATPEVTPTPSSTAAGVYTDMDSGFLVTIVIPIGVIVLLTLLGGALTLTFITYKWKKAKKRKMLELR